MADNKITVYLSAMSPPARSVQYLLDFHKNTSVTRQFIDLSAKEQLSPWFVELNPFHTVPVLRDETTGVVLYESTAIMEYLSDIFGWTGDYGVPTDIAGKYAVINQLHKYHNFGAKANYEIMQHIYSSVFGGQPLNVDALKGAVEEVKKTRYTLLEEILTKNKGFLTGTTPTIADLRLWSDLFQLSTYGDKATLAIVDFKEYPAIDKFLLAIKDAVYTEEKWASVLGFYTYIESNIGTAYRLAEQQKE